MFSKFTVPADIRMPDLNNVRGINDDIRINVGRVHPLACIKRKLLCNVHALKQNKRVTAHALSKSKELLRMCLSKMTTFASMLAVFIHSPASQESYCASAHAPK